jgi:predicted ATP-grasp superfamily ATP-dependent carboligase
MTLAGARVLVTDAHTTAALAIVRSLASAGMDVTVAAEHGHLNLAAHSRFTRRVLACASASRQPLVFAEQITQELERTRYDLLIPLTDTSVTILRHLRERLDSLVTVALPSNDVLESARDKQLTIRIAQQNSVVVPPTRTFDSLSQLEAAAPGLAYPCVVKPRFSGEWDGNSEIRRGTVRFASSSESLRAIVSGSREVPGFYLIQALVAGSGVGVFVVADRGQPLSVFAHQRIRETNPTGGRASLARSIPPDARIVAPALRLLKALKWHGVAMVEFKDPGAPDAPVLMEVNGRFWGSLPLAIEAGVDFPVLLARLLLGQQVDPPAAYAVGVQCRYLKGDLSYLTAALKGRPPDWTGPFPRRLAAVAAVAPWPGRWKPYNFRLADPMPALWEAGEFLVDVAQSLASRARLIGGKRQWREV